MRGASRALMAVVGIVVGCALTACAVPHRDGLGLEAVAQERADRAEARVDALLASFEEYLTDRWPGVQLPETSVEAWVPPGAWSSAFAACASEASGLTIRVTPEVGVFAQPPPATVNERRDVDLAIYLCQGRLPPPGLAASEPGPVEIAWVTEYVNETLPACLRREGVIDRTPPPDPFAILTGAETPLWDPYVSLRGDPPALRRAQAMCPHPVNLLARLSPVGTELTGVPTSVDLLGEPAGGAP